MQRERVAKSDARQRAAEIRADGEAQLATIFQADDARWAEAVKVAQAAIDAANVTIDRHFDRDQVSELIACLYDETGEWRTL